MPGERREEPEGDEGAAPEPGPAATVSDSQYDAAGPSSRSTPGIPGERFGRYRSPARIGRGGMGEILEATDPVLLRSVAIKILPAGIDRGDRRARKFLAEAQITGQLEHPNIVPTHELGVTDAGHLYFSMKLVRGESLAQRIRAVAGSAGEPAGRTRRGFLEAFLKVCDAVAYAHSRGVVHRDLKPSNIMVGEFGEVLVMDWGIAKVRKQVAEGGRAVRVDPEALDDGRPDGRVEPGAETDADRTVDGSVLGTPAYMPPEQAAGEVGKIDARSDVYALGAILYEILTLTPPYRGSAQEVLNQIALGRLEPPSERAPRAGIPAAIEAVVLKAMAAEREDRYASVGDLARDVRAYLEGYAVSARRDRILVAAGKWIRRNRTASIGIAALVAGLAFAAGVERMLTAGRVESLVGRARAKLERGDFDGARDDATGALALAPDHREAEELIEASRRRADLAGRVDPLRAQLEAERAAVASADPGDRGARYRGRTRVLLLARELVRLLPDSGPERRTLAESARSLAHVLAEDENFEMAELMIDEAEASGLDPALAKLERWRIAEARGGPLRKAQAILEAGRTRFLQPAERDSGLDELLRLADEAAVAALIPGVLDGPRSRLPSDEDLRRSRESRRLAIETLGRIGDGRTVALLDPRWFDPARPPRTTRRSGVDDSRVHALLADRLARWLPEGGPSRVDAVQAISLSLLAADADGWFDLTVSMANALGRLADPRAEPCLSAKRWAVGPGSSFWRATQRAHEAVALPDLTVAERTDPVARLSRARSLHGMGRLDEAIAEYVEVERLGTDRAADLHADRGLARLESGDPHGALADLDAAVRLDGTHVEARLRRAMALLATGAAGAARADLDVASNLHPTDPRIAFVRGRAGAASAEPETAIAYWSRAIELDPRFVPALLARAASCLASGRAENALADATVAVGSEPTLAEAYRLRSLAFLGLGRPQAALEDAHVAVVLDAGSAACRAAQGRAHAACGNTSAAIESLVAARALDPSDRSVRLELAGLHVEAARRGRIGDWVAALDGYTTLLEEEPERAEIWWGRGIAQAGAGRHRAAIADLDRALALDPLHADALADRAGLRLDRGEDASADLEASLRTDPTVARARRWSILRAAAAGDRDGVLGHARAAFALPAGGCRGIDTPDRRSMEWLRIGQVLQHLGQRDLALAALDRSMPDLPASLQRQVRELRQAIERGR